MTERMTDKQMADMSGDCVKCRQYKERISELQLEVQHKMCSCAELQHRIDELEQSAAKKDNAIISHQKRISELEAKLERVRKLPAHEATLENGRTGFIVDAASLVKALADDE